jgi:hypothetical protein
MVGVQREDYLLLFAQCLFFIWISVDTYTATWGFMDDDRSYFDNFVKDLKEQVGSDQTQKLLKAIYASAIPYYFCIWVIKGAILGLYYRIIPRQNVKTRWFLYFTTALTILSGFVVLCINAFLCNPISSNWSLDWDNACYSSTAVTPFIISVIFNLITDLMILVAPFPILKTLPSLNHKQKVGLTVTFSLGAITIIVCVVRAVILASSAIIPLTAVLTAVECFTAMVVATLPAMRVLLRSRSIKKKLSSQRKSDNSDENNITTSSGFTPVSPATGNTVRGGGGFDGGYDDYSDGRVSPGTAGPPPEPSAYEKRYSPLPPTPNTGDTTLRSNNGLPISHFDNSMELSHFQTTPHPPLPGSYAPSNTYSSHIINEPLPQPPRTNSYFPHHQEQRDPFMPDYLHHRQPDPTI